MRYVSKTITDTQKIAQNLAQKPPSRLFALVGDLGSGKTTFTQFLLRALGVQEERLTSPTFLVIKSYHLSGGNYKKVFHIDCYRLRNSQQLLDLGWQEIIDDQNNIVIIEWADRVKDLLPEKTIWLSFQRGPDNERFIDY